MRAILIIVSLFLGNIALAHNESSVIPVVREFLKKVAQANNNFRTENNIHEKDYINKQTPRATVIMCSDSRVQNYSIIDDDINDLFVVRNIGNQVDTSAGSVEYGVEHLHTPVLLVVGHSSCGAIEAAMSDFSKESVQIRKELETLDLKSAPSVNEAIIENVNHQVDLAYDKFKGLVKERKLAIVGTIYDFNNDFKRGYGSLIIINVNGEKDPMKLANNPNIKGINNIIIGVGN